jgi:hypothetical protein
MDDTAQVTNYDATANILAAWRKKLPRVLTVEQYMEAVKLCDALLDEIERFEKSAAFKRITRAQ